MKPIRVSLGEQDFRTLVSGGVIEKPVAAHHVGESIEITLVDIGYPLMKEIVEDVSAGGV